MRLPLIPTAQALPSPLQSLRSSAVQVAALGPWLALVSPSKRCWRERPLLAVALRQEDRALSGSGLASLQPPTLPPSVSLLAWSPRLVSVAPGQVQLAAQLARLARMQPCRQLLLCLPVLRLARRHTLQALLALQAAALGLARALVAPQLQLEAAAAPPLQVQVPVAQAQAGGQLVPLKCHTTHLRPKLLQYRRLQLQLAVQAQVQAHHHRRDVARASVLARSAALKRWLWLRRSVELPLQRAGLLPVGVVGLF